VKARTKHPIDITVARTRRVWSYGKTAFVTNANFADQPGPTGDSVSTIDVKTRTKHLTDITVGPHGAVKERTQLPIATRSAGAHNNAPTTVPIAPEPAIRAPSDTRLGLSGARP
jgi:hypothetical protein